MVVRSSGAGIKLLFLFLLHGVFVLAQPGYLSRKVTLNIPSCSLDLALLEIGKAADFRFSYDADLIPGRKQVTLKATNKPVGTLLKEILGKEVRPKEVGNHVILIRGHKSGSERSPSPEMVISGTVLGSHDRKPVGDVTIYEVEHKRSTLSASDGTYRLVLSAGKKYRSLAFCKSGFADTIVFVRQSASHSLDVILRMPGSELSRMERRTAETGISTTDSLGLVNWLVPREAMVNAGNLTVRTSRTFQASLIPYIGTNWRVSGSITNRFSLNVLAGYTGGLKGLEIGGLLNITRKEISGVQIAGLGNIVGGRGKGWQIGGLFNYGMGGFDGVQIGGLMNYAPDTITGVQVTGLASIVTGRINGVQVTGLANIVTRNSDAWQVAGLTNITGRDARKVQISGLMNYANNLDGVQAAGLVNIVRRNNSGVQVAGLFNYATNVYGLQLGLINVSNTVEGGVPIGLFSYVQKGYHLFEISGNEIFYGNIGFKSGTKAFYNFVQAGIGSDYKLQASYGIGTIFTLKKKLSMNIDASAGFVWHPTGTEYHGLLLKFGPALEYRFARRFAIFGGPVYNCFVFSKGKPSATPQGLSTYDFYFTSTENASIQMWIGGTLGVRF